MAKSYIDYCYLCERNVPLQKKFDWVIFVFNVLIFGIVTLGLFPIIQLIAYFNSNPKYCPICKNKVGKDTILEKISKGLLLLGVCYFVVCILNGI